MRVCDTTSLPYGSRPVSRFLAHGPESLTTPELLSIILGSNYLSSLELADIMTKSLAELKEAGISQAVALKIAAVREIGKRSTDIINYPGTLSTSRKIAEYIMPKVRFLKHEELHLISLTAQLRLISETMLTRGTAYCSPVSVRETVITALKSDACSVVLVHNHPSGESEPSPDDISVTEALKTGFSAVGIRLLDHIIIGENYYYSFKEHDLI